MSDIPIVELNINFASRVDALDSLHDFAVLVCLPKLEMIGNNATRATREMPRIMGNCNPDLCTNLPRFRWGACSMG